jgi:hypothetical protein
MCEVANCSNVPTKKVAVIANTIAGERQSIIDVCEEHWSALNGVGPFSMGCAPTGNQGDSVGILQQINGVAKPKS